MVTDAEKKAQFDKIWTRRLEESKYNFEWWGGDFSNRQISIGDIVELRESSLQDFVRLRVADKPYYMDNYGKARYRWYLVCRELQDDDTIIVAKVEHVARIIS